MLFTRERRRLRSIARAKGKTPLLRRQLTSPRLTAGTWVTHEPEAQIGTMLTMAFAVALFGWALVHIASSPTYPHEDHRPTGSRFRRWLNATRYRLLKARD
jgi:hypothetical protein